MAFEFPARRGAGLFRNFNRYLLGNGREWIDVRVLHNHAAFTGYWHSASPLDEAAISHIFKEHGDSASKEAKGRVAVTAEDFLRIPEITDPATADSVERGTTQGGIETIVYRKRYYGHTYVV